MKTTSEPARLRASTDRARIHANGRDLAFVTVSVVDENGLTCPRADNLLTFDIQGPGEIVATDNGDPTNMTPFHSHEREAFNGLSLVIVRTLPGKTGVIRLTANSESLEGAAVTLRSFAERK